MALVCTEASTNLGVYWQHLAVSVVGNEYILLLRNLKEFIHLPTGNVC